MDIYTYSDARQNLSSVLDRAQQTGGVLIKRRDGSLFALAPQKPSTSPFDVDGLDSGIDRTELLDILRESRETRNL